MDEIKIACPKCDWEPLPDSRWACSCLHTWNTFDTAGRCPACGRQWHHTCCLDCHQWSPHVDWYRNLDEWWQEALDEITEPITTS